MEIGRSCERVFRAAWAYKRRMTSSQALPPEIDQALARGAIILTANQRAARSLRRSFDQQQRTRGAQFWEPPPIVAWQSWLTGMWQRLLVEGKASELLLNASQEHALWRAIILADSETSSLRPLDALAETAARTWALLHAHRERLQGYVANNDNKTFARWAKEFEQRCRHSQYLPEAQLAAALRDRVSEGLLAPAAEALLVGFDSYTPAQTALLEALKSGGMRVSEQSSDPVAEELHLAGADSERDEFAACARWLRTRLEADPQASIAVIVPSIESCRAELDRTFREILAPELNDISAPINTSPYEFSLGVPLASVPMIACALDLLRWTAHALPVGRISSLLLTPYFAMRGSREDDLLARAEFDAFVLRQKSLLQPQLSVDALHRLVSNEKRGLPLLAPVLNEMRQALRKAEFAAPRRTHAEWVATMQSFLEAAGWAVPAQLDSLEYQTRRKWESVLDELATLDFDDARVSFDAAMESLERIATTTLFAPEASHTPIQILGPLEAAGSSFDAIWFLRANDLEWPAPASTNPLLPWKLQRDLGMPGANPMQDADRARRITQRIAASAAKIIFSFARESAQGHQRASTALAGLGLMPWIDATAKAGVARERVDLDLVVAEPRIPKPPPDLIHGGASVLEMQAACGFRAFAERRLFASSLDSAVLGLDPGERGSLVHDVLDKFWERVVTQAALKSMTYEERKAILSGSIDAALAEQLHEVEEGWPAEYVATERQRLINLLMPWLDEEMQRQYPFTVKLREEKLHNVFIDPLHLEIRVDRVDEVRTPESEEPVTVILDYKTGLANPGQWMGDRPDQPQLPLYAVVSKQPNLAAIAFASIRPGKERGLVGFADVEGILPKRSRRQKLPLADQVLQWEDVLKSLAKDFHSGRATVAPKQYPETCAYCQQRLLCRLDVNDLGADVIEEKDDEERSEWEENHG